MIATVLVYAVSLRVLTTELQDKGMVITENLATNSIEPILTEDMISLRRYLFDVKDVEEDVSYVYVIDGKGNLLAHTFSSGFPDALLDVNIPDNEKTSVQLLDTDEGYIRDIAVPVLDGKAGVVHLGISETRIRNEVFKTSKTLMYITILMMVIGGFLSYFLGSLVVRPVYALKKGAAEIGRGNLDYQIKVDTTDEIGALADAFNEMAKKLKSSMEKTRGYSAKLEEKVEERTKELLLLQKINNLLNQGASQDEILNAITHGLTTVFNYDSSTVNLMSSDRKHLICKSYSIEDKIIEKLESLTGLRALNYQIPLKKDSPLTMIVRTKMPFMTDDIVKLIIDHTDNELIHALAGTIARVSNTKYGVGVPLLSGDRVVGVIGIGTREKVSTKDVERLANFAAQAGMAVEKAQMEKQLKEYSKDLEKKVKEKSAQLIQSEKLASLGLLASGVAHEINNPLASIMLCAERLRDKDLDSGTAKIKLDEIITQVEIASNIVKNLIDFSRQSKPETTQININMLIEKTLEMVPFEFRVRGIHVEKDYMANLPEFNGDPNQLGQVFLNIFVNAIQAMPDGGNLTVSTFCEDRYIKVSISDTGNGIREEDLNRIFDPFFTTKKVEEGTGLGLSICLGIVERHGGHIEVESKVNVGSTFTISLPYR